MKQTSGYCQPINEDAEKIKRVFRNSLDIFSGNKRAQLFIDLNTEIENLQKEKKLFNKINNTDIFYEKYKKIANMIFFIKKNKKISGKILFIDDKSSKAITDPIVSFF